MRARSKCKTRGRPASASVLGLALALALLVAAAAPAAHGALPRSGDRVTRTAHRDARTMLGLLNRGSQMASGARAARDRLGFEVTELKGKDAPALMTSDADVEAAGLGEEEMMPHTETEAAAEAYYGRERAPETGRAEIELVDGGHVYALRGSALSDTRVAEALGGVGAAGPPTVSLVEQGAEAGKLLNIDPALELLKKKTTAGTFPARLVGRLALGRGRIGVGRCTGTLVGRRAVLTAAHCFASRKTGKVRKGTDISWVPGTASRSHFPFSSFRGTKVMYPKKFLNNGGGSRLGLDVGVLCLKDDASKKLGGALPLRTVLPSTVQIYSYPAKTKGGFRQYRDKCSTKLIRSGYDLAYHYCDTEGGSSGASVLGPGKGPGGFEVVGVHRGACVGRKCNMYTRLAKTQLQFVRNAIAVCDSA